MGHTKEILDYAYSPEGTLIDSASRDGTVKLWHSTPDENESLLRRMWKSLRCDQVLTLSR